MSIANNLAKKIRQKLPKKIQRKLPREISIINISAKESRRLNRIYRKKDRSTNVLSIRYNQDYGEILICPEVIRREAGEQKHSYRYQMTWMIIHGMIHLAEIHHEESPKVTKLVDDLESRILRQIFDRA